MNELLKACFDLHPSFAPFKKWRTVSVKLHYYRKFYISYVLTIHSCKDRQSQKEMDSAEVRVVHGYVYTMKTPGKSRSGFIFQNICVQT